MDISEKTKSKQKNGKIPGQLNEADWPFSWVGSSGEVGDAWLAVPQRNGKRGEPSLRGQGIRGCQLTLLFCDGVILLETTRRH